MLCSELSLRKTIPPAAVGIAHHSILNQGFSIRNPLESTKARVIQPSWFLKFKECCPLSLWWQLHGVWFMNWSEKTEEKDDDWEVGGPSWIPTLKLGCEATQSPCAALLAVRSYSYRWALLLNCAIKAFNSVNSVLLCIEREHGLLNRLIYIAHLLPSTV